jgi:hypothetical protein
VFGVPILLAALTMGKVGGAYALRGQATAFADRLPGAAHELARAIRKRVPGQAVSMDFWVRARMDTGLLPVIPVTQLFSR